MQKTDLSLIIGKYSSEHILPFNQDSHLIKLKKNRLNKNYDKYELISTNGIYVKSVDGVFEIDVFFKRKRDVYVLTNKEKALLTKYIMYGNAKVRVLESDFNIFDSLKYSDNIEKSFSFLKKRVSFLKKEGIFKGTLLGQLSNRNQRGIYKQFGKKSSLDFNFKYLDSKSYQEVFRFSEFRSNKKIIALDFNSMYPSVLDIDLPHPEKLELIKDGCFELDNLKPGIYHVIIKGFKTSFIRRYHPFKIYRFGKNLPFSLDGIESIETYLSNIEIEYYRNHCDSIELINGIVSKETVYHPRLKFSKDTYKKRIKNKSNSVLNSIYKAQLLSIHSSTNQTIERRVKFNNIHQVRLYFEKEMNLVYPNLSNLDFIKVLSRIPRFKVREIEGVLTIDYPDYKSSNTLLCFSSLVISAARIKMLKTLEFVDKFESAEICYVNSDSLHVSIDQNRIDEFFRYISQELGEGLGKLKLECVADEGYWFDVGRYWLFSKGKLVQYRNTLFNVNFEPVLDKRKYNVVRSNKFITYHHNNYFNLERCHTNSKLLNSNLKIFQRYKWKNLETHTVAANMILNESLKSSSLKSYTILSIKQKIE